MDEKTPVPHGAQELADDQLEGVVGGMFISHRNHKYYKYVGGNSDADWNASYLCPNCGRPVHHGGWGLFYCDPCDERWWREASLVLSLESGMWQEITRKEYRQIQMDCEI